MTTTTSQATATTSALGSGTGGGQSAQSSTAVINNSNVIANTSSSHQNYHQNNINNGSNSNSANNIRVSESSKRKKLKSRNTDAPNTNYSKEHLDAWLETCLKDATNTQLSSSSEFLDYNPSSNYQLNKKPFPQQQQQQQQQMLIQQQQQQQQLPTPPRSAATPSHQHQHHHHHHQSNHHRENLQQFALRMPPPSLSSGGYSTPFSQGFQKSLPTFMKNSFTNRFPQTHSNANNHFQQNDGSIEFASLPPIVNIMGSEHENNSTDVLDGSSNPNISRGFRFSDPCLLNPSDNDSKMSGQNTPDRRNNGEMLDNNKFFTTLMEQINLLHETNSKICRNLHETKVDIEALKHAPNWGLRHRRDSMSGLSTHSQPLGYGFGTQSPAPTYHSGAYTPGMMTDVVREVKEAARVREDALLSRVKSMVEERSWSMGEGNLRMMRDIEDLKSQVQHLRADRKDSNKRITHLETENKYMRQMLGTLLNNRSPDIIYENEALRLLTPHRTNFMSQQDMCTVAQGRLPKRSNSLNLHYGTIHHQTVAGEEPEEQMNALHIMEPLPNTTAAARTPVALEPTNFSSPVATDIRNSSFSSSDGGGIGQPLTAVNSSVPLINGAANTPPVFALVSTSKETAKRDDQHNETQELRRELHEALAAQKQADNRVIALENMVKKLQVKTSSIANGCDERSILPGGSNNNLIGGGSAGGGGCSRARTNGGSTTTTSYGYLLHTPTQTSTPSLQKVKPHPTIGTATPTSSSSSQNHLQNIRSFSSQQPTGENTSVIHASQHLQQLSGGGGGDRSVLSSPPKMSLAGPITDL